MIEQSTANELKVFCGDKRFKTIYVDGKNTGRTNHMRFAAYPMWFYRLKTVGTAIIYGEPC